jgi:hypothetical protein
VQLTGTGLCLVLNVAGVVCAVNAYRFILGSTVYSVTSFIKTPAFYEVLLINLV